MTLDFPPPAAGAPLRAPRHSGRFPEPEESTYHLEKFDELRRYMQRVMLSLPPLIVGLWLWDWTIDPLAAPSTLLLRIGMAACLVPSIVALRSSRVSPGQYTVLLYVSVLATEALFLAILHRLRGGMLHGVGAYMYYVLGTLLVGLPLRFRDNVLGLSVTLLVPDLVAAAGWLPGFSFARYNALVLPAGGLSLFAIWAFDRLYRRLFRYQRDTERLASEDALTALANRRQFMSMSDLMFEQARRYAHPASLIVIDLDHFKEINDRYGHAAGDAVLQAVAALLREHQRSADLVARMGGEEFALLLPETDAAGALVFAERLRAGCEALRVPVPGGVWAPIGLTMSLGVAQCEPDDPALEVVLRRADAALYRAKNGGRNRVEQ